MLSETDWATITRHRDNIKHEMLSNLASGAASNQRDRLRHNYEAATLDAQGD